MTDLYSLWTRQLLREFDEICGAYALNLPPPAFEISRSQRVYGSGHPDSRTIKISDHLIRNFSWDKTLQVLKHEMAHQVCSEVFGNNDSSHGPAFQKACDLLRLEPIFRRSNSDLAGEVESPEEGTETTRAGRRFIAKVEKLLSLARSANENEAALAMEKAGALMEKYNLRDLSAEGGGYTCTIINSRRKRLEGYQRRICTILQEYFYVKVVLSRLYDPEKDQYHKTMELLGRQENVEIAGYCYYFLENRLPMLWKQHRKTSRDKGIRARNSYYYGLLEGFRDKLRKQEENRRSGPAKKESSIRTRSIVCLENDPGLQEFLRQRYPGLAKGRKTTSRVDSGIFAAGREKGGTIVFHKGVTDKQGDNGRLLE
ncbi:MAG: SprT-like domain-containing protein [Desulfurivibrionaceae bacterium]